MKDIAGNKINVNDVVVDCKLIPHLVTELSITRVRLDGKQYVDSASVLVHNAHVDRAILEAKYRHLIIHRKHTARSNKGLGLVAVLASGKVHMISLVADKNIASLSEAIAEISTKYDVKKWQVLPVQRRDLVLPIGSKLSQYWFTYGHWASIREHFLPLEECEVFGLTGEFKNNQVIFTFKNVETATVTLKEKYDVDLDHMMFSMTQPKTWR